MVSKDNRKVYRVKLSRCLEVQMGSIGSDVKYELVTNDISPNGFFLDFEAPGRFPFNPSSIMEVWLSLGDQRKIFFNGKMARVVYPSSEKDTPDRPGIAIRIVQITEEAERELLDFIKKMAESESNRTYDNDPVDLPQKEE